MRESGAQYLTAIRDACRTAARSLQDVTEQRRLEQVCQVLNRLIVDATDLPGLQAEAAKAYGAMLMDTQRTPQVSAAGDFAVARRQALELVRGLQLGAGGTDIGLAARVVEIERDYFSGYDAAFQRVATADRKNAGSNAASGAGDRPNAAALGEYLGGVFGKAIEVTHLGTVALGFSKATYVAKVRVAGKAADDLIIRMDRPFNYLGTTVVDEFPILQVLHRNAVCVPKPFSLEPSGKVLGQPFLVVSRADGRNLGSHFDFPQPDLALCTRFAQHLARIHAVPVSEFGSGLRGSQYSASQQLSAAIDKYYADWTELNTAGPIIETAFQWIKQHTNDVGAERTFVHGDFSLSNVLIDERGDVAAILDWEFAGLGHRASDLGWFYFMAKALGGWDHFLQAYEAAGGILPDRKQLEFYVLWGALRLAIMNYQLDCGFESGRSSDLKHAYAAAVFLRDITLRVADLLRALM